MSSLRLALKQSLQESTANQHNDDSDAASLSEHEYSTDPGSDKEVSATQHSAANKIQSKWKSSSKGRDHSGKIKKHSQAAQSLMNDDSERSDVPALFPGEMGSGSHSHSDYHSVHSLESSTASAIAPGPGHADQQSIVKKKKKARNKKHSEDGDDSLGQATVPHPTLETVELQHSMNPKKARKHVTPGLRVKVRFATMKEKKKKKWFGGRISAVSKEGSKIRIKYDDGTTEVTRFPDRDVIVDDEGNGQHSVSADKFIPRLSNHDIGLTSSDLREFPPADQFYPAKDHVGQPSESASHNMVHSNNASANIRNDTIKSFESTLEGHEQGTDSRDGENSSKQKLGGSPKLQPIESVSVEATLLQEESTKCQSPVTHLEGARLNKHEKELTLTDEANLTLSKVSGVNTNEPMDARPHAEQRMASGMLSSAITETTCSEPKALSHVVSAATSDAVSPDGVRDVTSNSFGDIPIALSDSTEGERMYQEQSVSETFVSETMPNVGSLTELSSSTSVEKDESRKIKPSLTKASDIESTHAQSDDIQTRVGDNHTAKQGAQTSGLESRDIGRHDIPMKRLHIHIPAHKITATGDNIIRHKTENTDRTKSMLQDVAAAVSEGAKHKEMVETDSLAAVSQDSSLAPFSSAQHSESISDGDTGTNQKRKRDETHGSGLADGRKSKQAKNMHWTDGSAFELQGADGPPCIGASDKSGGSVKVVQEALLHQQGEKSISQNEATDQSIATDLDLGTSSVNPSDMTGALDTSIVRAGRRAAQQANERISSRQELVIDSPDGKKGKKKRRHEMDDMSEASNDDSQWVQCDSCSKWRVIPFDVVSTLPTTWYCSDNLWDPKRASCDAPEQTPKQVAKEKKKRKKAQQRMRDEVEVGGDMITNVTATSRSSREPTPEQDTDSTAFRRSSPDILVEPVESHDKEKKLVAVAGKKNRHDLDNHIMNEGPHSDANGRRGRGRPRRAKEAIKQTTETEMPVMPQSTSGATDETENLEWVQCEHCQKWRKLPAHISADDLPDVWYCSMNTWNVASASCDAPEDKADGLQDIGFHGGSGSGKLSYRNLIFGNNGRKPNRPISERARAAESLFLAPNNDEDAPPVVMYANSSAFVVRKKGNPTLVPDDSNGLSVLDLMSRSNLWAELRASNQSFVHLTSSEKPNQHISYTYDTLPLSVQSSVKEYLLDIIGEGSLTSEEILEKSRSQTVDDTWSTPRAFCDMNVIVTTLCELVKAGTVRYLQGSDLKDWNPRYQATSRKTKATVVAVEAPDDEPLAPKKSRCLKISKPWKHG